MSGERKLRVIYCPPGATHVKGRHFPGRDPWAFLYDGNKLIELSYVESEFHARQWAEDLAKEYRKKKVTAVAKEWTV